MAISLAQMPCDGFAIGGLAVGEPTEVMYEIIEAVEPHMPQEKPRYLMGGSGRRDIDSPPKWAVYPAYSANVRSETMDKKDAQKIAEPVVKRVVDLIAKWAVCPAYSAHF